MINQSSIRTYAGRTAVRKSDEIVNDARREGRQTAFLSHSHKDSMLAKGLQSFLQAQGWIVYIDWEDRTMPPIPDRETARKIKERIVQLDWFLFLATENSSSSRWCPWEIGYADGVKDIDRIVIVPTTDDHGRHYGNEYLGLYRKVAPTTTGRYALFSPKTDSGTLLGNVRP